MELIDKIETGDSAAKRELRRLLAGGTRETNAPLLDALATSASKGSQDSCEELIASVRDLGLAKPAIRKYLMSDHDVDAAEQATFVALAYRIDRFAGTSRFTTWLHTVAANEAKQVVRGKARHSDRRAGDAPEDLSGDNFVNRVSSVIANEQMVRAAMGELPENHLTALVLREEQALSYEEIAEQLEVPLGTAKTWVRRARMELSERLVAAAW
jgi:RNA polymerase sigma-70 factor (ECF subfamily)